MSVPAAPLTTAQPTRGLTRSARQALSAPRAGIDAAITRPGLSARNVQGALIAPRAANASHVRETTHVILAGICCNV